MVRRSKAQFPQGLKPASLLALSGTAEAVPFPRPARPQFFGGRRRGKPRLYTGFSASCEAVPFPRTHPKPFMKHAPLPEHWILIWLILHSTKQHQKVSVEVGGEVDAGQGWAPVPKLCSGRDDCRRLAREMKPNRFFRAGGNGPWGGHSEEYYCAGS
jgi:hypothetical protein